MRWACALLLILTPALAPAQEKKPAEDPEVEAYMKAQGWKIAPDIRLPDFKRVMALSPSDPKQPFGKVKVTDEGYKMLGRIKTVEFLNLLNVDCTDEGLKAIAANQALTSIVVQGDSLTDDGIKSLAGAKGLSNVALASCSKVTDAGVRGLAKLPKLETLKLIFSKVDGTCFDAFADCKTLKNLLLTGNEDLTDEGARRIAKLPGLAELSMTWKSKITSAGIGAIVEARLPAKFEFDKKLIDDALLGKLVAKGWLYGPESPGRSERLPEKPEEVRSISLSESSVTDKGYEPLLNCSYANSIFLDHTGITDATLLKMGGFKRLKTLSLKRCDVTAAGLAALSTTPLEWLGLEECTLTEEAFRAIGKMPKLKQLRISEAKFKPEWVKHLASLSDLKEVSAGKTEFDDEAAKALAGLPALESVDVTYTKLTDRGFEQLLKLPKLKLLSIDGSKVTKEAYAKAKKEHPKLTLYSYSLER